jgi:hypothetical protein
VVLSILRSRSREDVGVLAVEVGEVDEASPLRLGGKVDVGGVPLGLDLRPGSRGAVAKCSLRPSLQRPEVERLHLVRFR